LRITTKTLDTVMDYYPVGINWGNLDNEFRKNHPHIVLRIKNILWTSVMLVFKKS
jgi:hypothetical protein